MPYPNRLECKPDLITQIVTPCNRGPQSFPNSSAHRDAGRASACQNKCDAHHSQSFTQKGNLETVKKKEKNTARKGKHIETHRQRDHCPAEASVPWTHPPPRAPASHSSGEKLCRSVVCSRVNPHWRRRERAPGQVERPLDFRKTIKNKNGNDLVIVVRNP